MKSVIGGDVGTGPSLTVGDTILGELGTNACIGEVIAVDECHTAIKWGRFEIITIDNTKDLALRRIMRFRPAPSWWRRLFRKVKT